jgi:hypothetical protein
VVIRPKRAGRDAREPVPRAKARRLFRRNDPGLKSGCISGAKTKYKIISRAEKYKIIARAEVLI